MKTDTTKKRKINWKKIALHLSEEVIYQRYVSQTLVGQLPSTLRLTKLARSTWRKA